MNMIMNVNVNLKVNMNINMNLDMDTDTYIVHVISMSMTAFASTSMSVSVPMFMNVFMFMLMCEFFHTYYDRLLWQRMTFNVYLLSEKSTDNLENYYGCQQQHSSPIIGRLLERITFSATEVTF
jgi:hypothetical protein